MKNKFLLFLMLGMTFFAACNDDDDPEVPPTLNEVAGEYTGDKLTATIDGTAAGENASVKITRESDTTATLVLNNIVPNYESFEITKAAYTTASRSSFYSKLAGEATSESGDLKVAATAEITDGVMNLTVTTTEIEASTAQPSDFYDKSFTGDMVITVADSEMPAIPQTIQITAPSNNNEKCIRLLLADFSFGGINLGDIDLDNIELTEDGNDLTFEIQNETLTLPGLPEIVEILSPEVTVNAEGRFINGVTLQFTLDVVTNLGDMMTVSVAFEGTLDDTANNDSTTE